MHRVKRKSECDVKWTTLKRNENIFWATDFSANSYQTFRILSRNPRVNPTPPTLAGNDGATLAVKGIKFQWWVQTMKRWWRGEGVGDNFWYSCLFQPLPKERDNDVTRMKKTHHTTYDTHTASLASNKLAMNCNNVCKIFYPQNTGIVIRILILERVIPLKDIRTLHQKYYSSLSHIIIRHLPQQWHDMQLKTITWITLLSWLQLLHAFSYRCNSRIPTKNKDRSVKLTNRTWNHQSSDDAVWFTGTIFLWTLSII
jgi:hypothetical protein